MARSNPTSGDVLWSPKTSKLNVFRCPGFFLGTQKYFWYPLSWAICAHLKPLEVVWQKGWIPVMVKTYESRTRPPLLQRPWQAVAYRISFNLTKSGNAQKPLNFLQIEFGLWDHFFLYWNFATDNWEEGQPKAGPSPAHLLLWIIRKGSSAQ